MNKPTRRHFITTAVLAAPFLQTFAKTAPEFHGAIIGHGTHRYRVDKLWSQADAAKTPVKDCHEMVQVPMAACFCSPITRQNNVLIYDRERRSARPVDARMNGGPRSHLHREAGRSRVSLPHRHGAGAW
jgi:hypothetical protein